MCLTWLFMHHKETKQRSDVRAAYAARGLPPPDISHPASSTSRIHTDSGYHSGQQSKQTASMHSRANGPPPNDQSPPLNWQPPRVPSQFLNTPPKPMSQMQMPSPLGGPQSSHPYAMATGQVPTPPLPVARRGSGHDVPPGGMGHPVYDNTPPAHMTPMMVAR